MECFQIIKKFRKDKGLTQSQIANILNMTQSNYAKIEINKIGISVNDLKNLCSYYNVSADFFLGLSID